MEFQTEIIIDQRKAQRPKAMSDSNVGSGGIFDVMGRFTGTRPSVLYGRTITQNYDLIFEARIADFESYLMGVARGGEVERTRQPIRTFGDAILLMGAGVSVAQRSARTGQFRQRELEWRRTHRDVLQQYRNEWVVLEGEHVIAHGTNASDVIREAKSQGLRTPYIFFVEPESENVVRIGL